MYFELFCILIIYLFTLKLGANLFNFQFCLLPSITSQVKKKIYCIVVRIYSKLERRGCLQILKIIAAVFP